MTAANKQCSILMHTEYHVTLPNHDCVIAAKHTLIPPVYAKNEETIKPVVVISVVGGPDENPRWVKENLYKNYNLNFQYNTNNFNFSDIQKQ